MDSLFDIPPPDLPYAGTSGWSGTDTSEARARRLDESGRTFDMNEKILILVTNHGFYGATVAELRERLPEHHGTVSGTLTRLHLAGRIARLAEKRGGCKIYVAQNYVSGREVELPSRNKQKLTSCPHCGGDLTEE